MATELEKQAPKYPTQRASDILKQIRFASKPGRLEALEDKAEELLAALREAIGGGTTEDPDALSFTWKLDSGTLGVTVNPRTEPIEVLVTAEAKTATVALSYNASKARFESAEQVEPAVPGEWPAARNAVEVILEGCLRVLAPQ